MSQMSGSPLCRAFAACALLCLLLALVSTPAKAQGGPVSGPGSPSISFSAVTLSAPWEARANVGMGVAASAISYTAVGASSPSSLPAGSLLAYGGQNELPLNPNNGSGTFVSPEYDAWGSSDGASWQLLGGYTLGYGPGQFSSVPSAVSTASTAFSSGLPSFTEGQNSMKCTDRTTGRLYLLSGAAWQPALHAYGAPRADSFTSADGQSWANLTAGFLPPARLYGRCLVDSAGLVFVLGSRETAAESESNDVWRMSYAASSNTQSWTQQTAAAQWQARDSPGADSYTSATLQREILTLAGGYSTTAGALNDGQRGRPQAAAAHPTPCAQPTHRLLCLSLPCSCRPPQSGPRATSESGAAPLPEACCRLLPAACCG